MKQNLKAKDMVKLAPKAARIRVSIVEDDTPSREILADWLAHADGFEFVSGFACAEDGLEELPRQRPDVVLMDIKLPGLSGVECVRQLKPQLPQTQFVMHTVYEDSNHIFDALQSGATGYLLKQSAHDELLAALRYVHAGGSPMTSYIARRVAQCFPPTPAQSGKDESLFLSPREREVLEMLARGFLYKEIAEALNISVRTVDTYIRRIYEKLHVRSRGQAVAKYVNLPVSDSRSTPVG
ncbi:MAG TPA: response regulator transcription factor [Candidatus Acidoferrales bacterium]|nr:response regulator transcription factor [Candidatus Acidoferrales bacterium]